MKQKLVLILTLLLVSMSMLSQNTRNSYESNWEKVKEFEEKSLPQSAIKEIDAILQMAVKEKNTPQILKATIQKNEFTAWIESDNDLSTHTELENLIVKTSNSTEKAILYSCLAELYYSHYTSNRWQINQRTNLADVVPTDIKEWTANIYENAIASHIASSVKDVEALKKQTTKNYDDIMHIGKDSKDYYPTFYDFMMERAINLAKSLREVGSEEFDIASTGVTVDQLTLFAKDYTKLNIKTTQKYIVLKYYQDYLADLQKRGLTSTIVLTELDKLNYISTLSNSFGNSKKLETLIALEKEYSDHESSVEIVNAIVDALQSSIYNYSYSYRRFPINDGKVQDDGINEKIYSWLTSTIDKYPKYKRIDILKNRLNQLQTPNLRIDGENLFYANDNIVFDVIHQNNQIVKEKITVDFYKKVKNKDTFVKEYPLSFISKATYNTETGTLELGKLAYGSYVFKSKLNSDDKYKFVFHVSDLMAFYRNSARNEYEIYVVDRKTGKPVEGATVILYPSKYNERIEGASPKATLTTNSLGLAIYKDPTKDKDTYRSDIAIFTIAKGDDKSEKGYTLYAGSYNHRQYDAGNTNFDRETTSIFSDRSIYRPGQTVHYKAIVLDKDSRVINKSKQQVRLYNPNGEIISEKTLFTNEFGSIAGEFILPQGGLTGSYRINVNDRQHHYFNVEEYKRPTFEVKFDKIEKTYSFGEKITLKGNARTFSGINLQDANVNYRISRRPFSFWYWSSSNESHYEDGVVKTKDDGTFEIEFVPNSGDGNNNPFGKHMYTFSVVADITDINGETQSNTYTISVGEVSMILNVQIPSKVEKSQDLKMEIGAKNLDGVDIETSGSYIIYALNNTDSIESTLQTGTFKTGVQDELIQKIKKLNSGKLRLEVKGKDNNGKEVTAHTDFVLYSFDDKRPPYETNLWIAQKESTFKGNKPVEIIYGTSSSIHVLYQIYNNKNVFERKFVTLNNENKNFKVPYKTEYGDEIYMSFTTVKDGKLSTENILLQKEVEEEETSLNIKLDVFRDKLRPGQEETWTLSVKDSKDKVVPVEVLASMYDMSLDKLNPFTSWMLNKPYINKEYLNQIYYNQGHFGKESFNIELKSNFVNADVSPFDFDYFKILFTRELQNQMLSIGYGSVSKPTMARSSASAEILASTPHAKQAEVLTQESIMSDSMGGEAEPKTDEGMAPQEAPAPQLRKNFNETAFFFPQLTINEKGESVISFTVPESNTTWRFRAFAHDKDSKVGELEKTVVTRKELMITPNIPRFVRQGDITSIATKISNLSENSIDGNVSIEFFNPIDDKVVDLGTNAIQAYNLDKDASTSATWTFDIPKNIDLLGVRIVADSKAFSDGEQHVLAVLPNRMLVTESMPVDVLEKGEQSYTLEKLVDDKSASLENYKLTFEFASNPAWYAVQALPTMSNPENENAVNWFASYYVNTLGASLMKQYPKVANMIEAWKKQGADKQTLVSKLRKDEELKTILLEETPWVLDAKNETEQMERLSLLFDLNNTKLQTGLALKKLEELQAKEGAWTWYRGMYPSRSISQYILYGFASLQTTGMVEYPQEVKVMQMKALKYVDEQITRDFESLKKNNKDWEKITSISTSQLEYLYIRAMYRDIPITQEAREAECFYTNVVKKNWTKISLYEKSLLAVLLPQLGDKTLASEVTKSIREHSVVKKEMGMYWPNNKARVFLSMSAVSTHTFMMEALKANGATTEDMDMMKRWLVKQKQTQIWETSQASIDAIGALLREGSDWFASTAAPTIKVGKEVLKPESKELGTGYFKTSWSKSEINKNMAKVTLNSEDAKPAYGALYWQYYEDLDKITKQDGALNVNKELYKEVINQSGKSLVKITESNPLAVGDKVIVRLVVRTDRNLEFVQLKDMRASCFEPVNTVSGLAWLDGVPYYKATKDASTNLFFDVLPKGTYVFEYAVHVNRTGEYSNGITSIQCAYAPEFVSHTAGVKVVVK